MATLNSLVIAADYQRRQKNPLNTTLNPISIVPTMYTLQFFSVLWYYMHEKSTNCIPMQAHKRNTKMFYWKKPYLVLFMKQNGNTNGDLIYNVDLTEISKFPFQFPGKIQFDHIRDLSFQTISIYIVINFCVGLRTFYCIYRVKSMLYIEAM